MSPAIHSKISAICCLVATTAAHMEMSWPYPLHSKFNPSNSYTDIDYSMTSPLIADGSNFPCKGYQNDRPTQPTANYAAGSTYNLTLAGSATHDGGSCQISLSYDNGATFRVIKSLIGGCPLQTTYNFTIPSYSPSGNALLAWTWQNREGNREYYMNCAEVSIMASAYRRRKRQTFESLPYIWKANLEGVNDCTTAEGEDPVYPNPGADVVYGQDMSSSSTPSSGTCDAPTPYGQTYKDLGDSTSPVGSPGTNDTTAITPTASRRLMSASAMAVHGYATPTTPAASNTDSGLEETSAAEYAAHAPKLLVSAQSSISTTTTTVTAECKTTVTIILPPATHSAEITPSSKQPSEPTPTPPSNPNPGNDRSEYATDLTSYLPCVPWTFICTDATTWATCNYNDGTVESSEIWVYVSPRQVAAGMECLPYLSQYSAQTEQYAQQENVERGSYRDDRIVRARPHGDCSNNGALQCTKSGQGFQICDQGGWVDMGSVAAGTTCQNGAIVAA